MVKKNYPKNYIKEIRTKKGITVKQLADMVGVSGPYITMLENSERRMYHDNLIKIANALEVHPADITDGPVEISGNDEKQVLDYYRTLSDGEKRMFSHTLKSFAEKEKQPYDDFSDRIKPKKAD